MQTIGQMIPALGLIGLSFIGCKPTMAVVLLCICVGFNGASYSGFMINHMELSPNYAGTLMGIANMVGNVTGFVAPYVSGDWVNHNQTLAAWMNVFIISSGAYIAGNSVFVLFGSTEVQQWNTYWEQ